MSSRALMAPHVPGDSAVIVGRQPIVDRDATVVAFELLYRSRRLDRSAVTGEQMTADVLLSAMTIGVDQLVGAKTMYCNADRDFLLSGTSLSLPADRTVIEILETVEVDDEVVEACRRLVEAGFRLALDDFVWSEGVERLLELATVVKIDVLAGSRAEVLALAERCRPYGVSLLAEKVETEDDVVWARENGFDLFQGYAIERPALVHGRGVGTSGLTQAQLALTMLTAELDLDEIEDILRREPGLVVQVLQLASVGARNGMRRQVHTIREALMLLGSVRIRQWVALTILDQQPSSSPDGLVTALTRARMAEELSRSRGYADPDFAFLSLIHI